ncbi:hypothetical protein [Proteus phage 3H10_20]|uniref:Uncharacterized protein n=1 Tax=Proteus phage 3H10_20 TaxID=2772448 RepID=A0A7L7SGZ3_9CAUD|nr:hypothetical protein PQC37_gp018 [Proteus phage 3H10_20]QOC54804.1 hypothetical protein [Proteus phage 3H10_20]
MSKYGIIVIDDGIPLTLAPYSTYTFYKKFIFNSNLMSIGISDPKSIPLMFTRTLGRRPDYTPRLSYQNGAWRIIGDTSNDFICYIFVKTADFPNKSKWGIEVYNEKGEIVQKSGQEYLKIHFQNHPINKTGSFDVGFPCASMDRPVGRLSIRGPEGWDLFQFGTVGQGNSVILTRAQIGGRLPGPGGEYVGDMNHLFIDVRDYD